MVTREATAKKLDDIERMWNAGMSTYEISIAMGISEHEVSRMFRILQDWKYEHRSGLGKTTDEKPPKEG